MDQHIDALAVETDLDRIIETVVATGKASVIDRGKRPAVVILTLGEYLQLKPPPQWLADGWAAAKEAGLDKMTMDEIDAEIAAARREARERTALPE